MKRVFSLHGLKPLSVNSTYVRTLNGVMKTSAATEWFYSAFHILSSEENKQKLKELREYFDPKKHVYSFEIVALYPKKIFFTKQGTVNSKTIDVSNFEKSIIDIFCLKRYFNNPSPAGCENLNTDDRYVTDLTSRKAVSSDDEPRIEVEIYIKTLYRG